MPWGPSRAPPPPLLPLLPPRLVRTAAVAVVVLAAMVRAFHPRPPTQLSRLLLGSGWSRRLGRPPHPPLPPSGPFGGGLPWPRVQGVVVQAIEEGEYVVVKETGRRARVVSKQSNGTYVFRAPKMRME